MAIFRLKETVDPGLITRSKVFYLLVLMTALGATDTQLSALTSGTSQLGITQLSVPTQIEIPFVQVCLPSNRYRLSKNDTGIAPLLAPYESVTFVALSFSVEITGQAGRFEFAARTEVGPPSTDEEWLGAPVYQRFAGNAQGDTFAEYVFPSTHPFGVELKAVALGNDPPQFYFRFEGSTGDSCRVRGRLVVRGGGRGIIPAIKLTTYASNKSSQSDSGVSGLSR